jgi:transcriptional regulator with GAF, ATPase, and Fis domain
MPDAVNLRELLEEIEKGLIVRALKSSGGVQAEAARQLQLSRSDISYKLTKYGIKAEGE